MQHTKRNGTWSGAACFSLVMVATASGSFQVQVVDDLPSSPHDAVLSDIDGDGLVDLVVSLDASLRIKFNMQGNGLGGGELIVDLHETAPSLDAGDLSGNGLNDIALAQPGLERVVVLLNQGESGSAFSMVGMALDGQRPGRLSEVSIGEYFERNRNALAVGTEDEHGVSFEGFGGFQPDEFEPYDYWKWLEDDLEEWNYGLGPREEPEPMLVPPDQYIPRPRKGNGLTPGEIDSPSDKQDDIIVAGAGLRFVQEKESGAPGEGTAGSACYFIEGNEIIRSVITDTDRGYALQSWHVGNEPVEFVLADLNVDGHLDIVVVNRGDDTVSILPSTENGSFSGLVSLQLPATPGGITTGDYDGDGDADLAVKAGNGIDGILLIRNENRINGELVLSLDENFIVVDGRLVSLLSGDIDGDGLVDPVALLHVEGRGRGGCSPDVNRDGVIDILDLHGVIIGWDRALVRGDINRDGRADVMDLVLVLESWGGCS